MERLRQAVREKDVGYEPVASPEPFIVEIRLECLERSAWIVQLEHAYERRRPSTSR